MHLRALGNSGLEVSAVEMRFPPTLPEHGSAAAQFDKVAILNTTLRLVGRPAELREQLFTRYLEVRVKAAIGDPGRVFNGLPDVDSWAQEPSGPYRLAVSDPDAAAPAVARALVNAGADILSIAESRHSLEDVYLKLIDEDVEAKRR